MADFSFNTTVPYPTMRSALLGASTSAKMTDSDVGKAVKFGGALNYVLCSGGNDIEAFVNSVEPFTMGNGFSFGGVQSEGWRYAKVGANQGATPMAAGDYVVADTQTTLNTAGIATVKTGTPAKYFWRCMQIMSGTGVAGDSVLLYRDV
jgi:hypothetical protein